MKIEELSLNSFLEHVFIFLIVVERKIGFLMREYINFFGRKEKSEKSFKIAKKNLSNFLLLIM